jgi:hypothetical protein
MVDILGLWDLNWRKLDCFRRGGELLLTVHLLDIFDFATISCDFEMDWNIVGLSRLFLGELSKVLICGTAVEGGLG